MGKIEDRTEALVEAIQESSEYREFCAVKDKVGENPELREKINAFRRQVFDTQNSKEPLDMYGEMERIGREYEEIRQEPLVDEFLLNELKVCRILQKITFEVIRAVDLDTEGVIKDMPL